MHNSIILFSLQYLLSMVLSRSMLSILGLAPFVGEEVPLEGGYYHIRVCVTGKGMVFKPFSLV